MSGLFPKDGDSSKPQGYTVLARRYRSRDFDELVGQDTIARTLQNAIAAGRTAHAYLFCGTRGVGKTSTARIFAKAMNVTPDLKESKAIGEAILRGDDLDVIEIDAASNRGVDQARDLIANAGISPTRCRYKIYIIDEVHMLTKESFNTLLKTMEEPPAHVKFILCTTEAHKVPMTIQSRCQRFDFHSLTSAQIAQQLRKIVNDEGVAADDEVLLQIARLGRGSMRDALSVLDRLLSTGEKMLTPQMLDEALGLPDQTLINQLVDAVAAGDAAAALTAGAELLNRGSSVDQALELLAAHFRDLMILCACGADSELLEISSEQRKLLSRQAAAFDAAGLVHMIALCDSAARNSKFSSASRAIYDAVLVRLSLSEHLASIPQLLSGSSASAPLVKSGGGGGSGGEKKNALAPPLKPEPAASALQSPAITGLKPVASAPPAASPPLSAEELWDRVLATATSPSDHAKVEHLSCESFDGRTLRVGLLPSGAPMAGYLRTQTSSLVDLVRRATGLNVKVEFAASAPSAAPPVAASSRDVAEAAKDALVIKAMELFNASITAVRQAAPPQPRPARAESETADV